MKNKISYFILFYSLFMGTINGQSFETKKYKLNGFGILNIPNFLDTLGQDFSKKFMIENSIENMSNSGKKDFENEYQVNLTKLFLSNYDSSVILFWPSYSLLYLFDSNVNKKKSYDTLGNFSERQFTVIPNIMLQRKKYIYTSARVKQLYLKKEEKVEYSSRLAESYTSMIKSLFQNITVTDITSHYFLYLNDYPTVKISYKYTISENNKISSYNQDLYTMYKGIYNYLFRFEYPSEEKNKWESYEVRFFKEMKLL